MNRFVQNILTTVLVGGLAGFLGAKYVLSQSQPQIATPTDDGLISEFYRTETAVHVSPHHLRKGMMKGDDSFILVDLRSPEEYEREHVVGAINIAAYKDANTSAYGEVDRIVSEFKALDQEKEIIVYCYSTPCMTGRKIGKILADEGIYVKHLGVGWNEWRYGWETWNHEHEWADAKVEDYVVSGTEPGKYQGGGNPADVCPIEGELGC